MVGLLNDASSASSPSVLVPPAATALSDHPGSDSWGKLKVGGRLEKPGEDGYIK